MSRYEDEYNQELFKLKQQKERLEESYKKIKKN